MRVDQRWFMLDVSQAIKIRDAPITQNSVNLYGTFVADADC